MSTTGDAGSLRVGLLLDDSLDRTDGVQQHVLTLGRWLTRQGHEVHYVAPSTGRVDLPHLHQLGRGVPVRFNGNTLTTPALVTPRALRAVTDRLRLDVLHVAMPYSPLLSGRVIDAMPARTAVVGTFHILPTGPVAERATHLLGRLERRRLRRFDAFMAVSQVAARFADEAFGVAAQVVPNPVELTGFVAARARAEVACAAGASADGGSRDLVQASGSPPVRVVFLGRLVPRKGPLELVAAVAHLVQQGLAARPFRLLLGGRGPLHDQLAEQVRALGLDRLAELVGAVPESAKAAFLADADVVALPSVGGESFGISVVEALAAAGGPVLVGDNPGYRELVGPLTSLLVDPADTAAFAHALATAIDGAHPGPTVDAQRALAATFDVERVGPRVVEVYRSAIGRRRAADAVG